MSTCNSTVGILNTIIADLNLKGCATYNKWLSTVTSLDDCYYILELVQNNYYSLENCERTKIIVQKLKSDILEKLSCSFDSISTNLFDL